MYNIIVWGTGRGYNKYFNLLKYFELKREISILGIISNDKEINNTIDGYKLYSKSYIRNVNFDYCIVSILNFDSIKEEAVILGIPIEKLIPIRVLEVPYFNFKKYIYLKEKGVSILSRNCWGGICYHYLGLEFQSPTINMFFSAYEFNKFVANLKYYLSLPIEFVEMRYEQNLKQNYPVGRLDDILIHFNHYIDFEDAVSAWERRKKRMNMENIVVISSTTVKEDAIEFTKLPFKNKLIFIPRELNIKHESCFSVNYKDNGDGVSIGMYSNGTANGSLSMIDLLSYLNQMDYIRTN